MSVPNAQSSGEFTHDFMDSLDDSNPIKRLILASGYVDFNHLKQKAKQGDEGNVVEKVEAKVDL